jgi:sulfite reductase (NADPH) flavoprotein alpha-component
MTTISPKLMEEKISMSKTSFESVDESMAPTLNARRPDGANGTGEQCRTLYRDVPVQWSGSSLSREDSILILYGTVTGNAEMLANKLAAMVRGAGRATQVHDMAHCPATVLSEASCVLIVTSTYGDGEPPEDAAPFWEAVVHGNGLDLRGVKFSVLALGNTTFDHFCKCGRDLDAALERHGATRFYPRVDCDVDYDVAATHWISKTYCPAQGMGKVTRPCSSVTRGFSHLDGPIIVSSAFGSGALKNNRTKFCNY